MADGAVDTMKRNDNRDAKAEFDERRIAKGIATGLPLVTLATALIAAMTVGAPLAILIAASGVLLGVISLFWASLRVLSGEAALSPELEALDATAHAVDALSSRKKMLVRALKDLDNERALGKLEDEDYEQLSRRYRGDLKDTLVRIDASLAPHRSKAEEIARDYLSKVGTKEVTIHTTEPDNVVSTRVACTKCEVSNEPDATFCKNCGSSLAMIAANDKHRGASNHDAEDIDEA